MENGLSFHLLSILSVLWALLLISVLFYLLQFHSLLTIFQFVFVKKILIDHKELI